MKIIFTSIFTILLVGVFGQDFMTTNAIIVADGEGSHHPQIEILNDGVPAITWTDGASKNIYFAKHDGISGFNTPIQLNPTGLDVQSYNWSGPDLAIEGDNIYVVFKSYGYETGGIYVVKSTNNGTTFGDTVRVDDLADGFAQYPDLTVLNDTVYVTFMNHDTGGSNPSYDVARSVDGGLTFGDEVLGGTLITGEACDCCQPEISVNDDFLMVFYRNNDDNIRDIKAVISYDRGASFTDWISADDHNWLIPACPATGPDTRFIDDSKIAVTYKSEVDDNPKVFLNIYDLDADVSVEMIEIYSSDAMANSLNYPQVCFDDGMLGIVWEDFATGTSLDVFFNSSSSTDIDFNPDNALNLTELAGVQSKPDIALNSGIFHVVYADAMDNNLYYLQVGEPNSLPEFNSELSFNTYMSATNEQLIVDFSGKELDHLSITISDINGKLIEMQTMANSHFEMSTKDWSSGVYLVTLTGNGQRVTKKVVR